MQLVTIDQAKILKKIGFSQKVSTYYYDLAADQTVTTYSAPNIEDVIRWLLEDKDIQLQVWAKKKGVYDYKVTKVTESGTDPLYFSIHTFPTYEGALLEGLDRILLNFHE